AASVTRTGRSSSRWPPIFSRVAPAKLDGGLTRRVSGRPSAPLPGERAPPDSGPLRPPTLIDSLSNARKASVVTNLIEARIPPDVRRRRVKMKARDLETLKRAVCITGARPGKREIEWRGAERAGLDGEAARTRHIT